MSVGIRIKNALKKYGDNTIIPDLSVDIHNGEFFTLLGPSGCGKTTLLRMIAGFNSIEGGDFYFNDKRINDMDPGKRNIGMVFQNYAIFPNMTVRKNVEFGLKNRKLPKEKITAEANKFMKLVHVDEYADRMPDRLSGGQQQRVALSRAIVIEPDLLLMDEPLSNLDAKLRVQMRTSIREIQRALDITTIYVTHDQEEALAVSDRIAVMNMGVVEQVGRPYDIYTHPVNEFVANFIGTSNFMEGEASNQGVSILGTKPVPVTLKNGFTGKVKVSVRPEQIELVEPNADLICGEIKIATFLGDFINYEVRLGNGQIIQANQYIHKNPRMREIGEKVALSIENMNVFTPDGKEALL